MAEELITFKEAQGYLGISKAKMGRLAKEGSLPVYTDPLDKRKKLVPRAEVEKLKQPRAVKGGIVVTPSFSPKPAAEAEKPTEDKEPPLKRMVNFTCRHCGERGKIELEWRGPVEPAIWLAPCPKCGELIVREKPDWAPKTKA